MNPEFCIDLGIVVPAVTTEQMREIDRVAMEETGRSLYRRLHLAYAPPFGNRYVVPLNISNGDAR